MADARGIIPGFPPIAVDADGRIIPMNEAERRARWDALSRVLAAIDAQGPDAKRGA